MKISSLKLTAKAPENQWLADEFPCAMLVSWRGPIQSSTKHFRYLKWRNPHLSKQYVGLCKGKLSPQNSIIRFSTMSDWAVQFPRDHLQSGPWTSYWSVDAQSGRVLGLLFIKKYQLYNYIYTYTSKSTPAGRVVIYREILCLKHFFKYLIDTCSLMVTWLMLSRHDKRLQD